MPIESIPAPIGNPKKPTIFEPPRQFITPTSSKLGMSEVVNFHAETAALMAQIESAFGGGAESSAAARKAINDRLGFGLRNLDLQREGLGIDRDQADINRRNSIEAAINNALQRGIFRSGIRVRNVQRAEEGAGLEGRRLDLRSKQINLSEEELRNSIKNALASLNESATNARRARESQIQQAQIELEMRRRQQLAETIIETGGVFDDSTQPVLVPGQRF